MKILTALITGASGAIGRALAHGLAKNHNFSVVLVCRNEHKAQKVVKEIHTTTQNKNVRYELADVSRKSSIAVLAKRWEGSLHVLLNCAAIAPRQRQETPEGIELQFATNVLGYIWMIECFKEILSRSAPSRVVNVASYWAGGLDMDDLEFKRRSYNNDLAYRQSKQANRMLTVAYAEHLQGHNISVNACHPGDVNSTLSNSLGFGGHETPQQGAETPLWLATSPTVEKTTGKYFEHNRETKCQSSADQPAIRKLYQHCAQYV